MNIQEKISEYKTLSLKLIDCSKELEKARNNHSNNVEEILLKSLDLRKAMDKCLDEIFIEIPKKKD